MTVEFESILPQRNSTPQELRIERVTSRHFDINADAISESKDPLLCDETQLSHLAWERSVDLWNEAWPLDIKRAVVASAMRLHAIKGTEQALKEYVQIAGGEVGELVTGPQGLFAAREPLKAEKDAYAQSLPSIKIYLSRITDVADFGAYEGDGFVGDFLSADRGPVMYGRRAVFESGGVQTPINRYGVSRRTVGTSVLETERVEIPGLAGAALFVGDGFVNADFIGALERAPVSYTVEIDRAYTHEVSDLWYSVLYPGLDPVSPRYERGSDIGDGTAAAFAGDGFLGLDFLRPDLGPELQFDILRLFDPTIAAPQANGDSFVGQRLGMAPNTAEAMIKINRNSPTMQTFVEGSFVGEAVVGAEDMTIENFTMDAVVVAKEFHSRVFVTFASKRPIEFRDAPILDGSKTLSSRVRAHL